MNVEVNFVAVLVAAISMMVLGFLWYGPLLFQKPWMKLKGYKSVEECKEEQKKMGPWYGLTFVLSLITAYTLTHVMAMSTNLFHETPMTTGLMSGFWMWLGFVMPTQAGATIFGEKKWKLFAIDTTYQLVSLLVMGVVLALLG